MSPVHVVAHFVSKPEAVEDARDALLTFVEPSRAQQGSIMYDIQQGLSNPNEFFIVAQWETEADLQAHAKSPIVAETVARLTPFLAQPSTVTACQSLTPLTNDSGK